MDVFIEKIVVKKKSFDDIAYIVLVILGGILIWAITFLIPFVKFFAITILVFIILIVYYLISLKNIEYEYSFTNGELDIDKILNKKKRKRLATFNCSDFEIVASINNEKHVQKAKDIKNKFFAVSSMNSPDVYFAVVSNAGEKRVLFFEPDKKMLDAIKFKIPGKVFM